MRAQEKDSLIACIEEVKQIREKEGPLWFSREELIDTGKRGPGAIGDMSR